MSTSPDALAADLGAKLDDTRRLTMAVLMTPDLVNFSGKVHGGAILRLLDQVAYACASRYSSHYVVTLSVDQVQFRAPVLVGDLVHALASINYVGTTSMEVGIKLIAESTRSRAPRHAISCFFTMVAVDAEGRPTPVPPLSLRDDDERRRFTLAELRRGLRRELQERYQDLVQQHHDGEAR